MKTFLVILFLNLIAFPSYAFCQSTQEYQVIVMDKHGTDADYHFQYSIPKKIASDQSKVNLLHRRIGEEMAEMTDEFSVFELIETIDSVGPKIEFELAKEFKIKNVVLLDIGVPKSMKEAYDERKNKNADRLTVMEDSDDKNYFYRNPLPKVKSRSEDLELMLKSKFGSDVLIEYTIHYVVPYSSHLPKNSLDQHIKDAIVDSLRQYEVYEMWALERHTLEKTLSRIISRYYPETGFVEMKDVVIPEEAEKHFQETDKARQAHIDKYFELGYKINELTKELESNSELSKSEIIELEEEIESLKRELKSHQEKGKTITHEYRPKL